MSSMTTLQSVTNMSYGKIVIRSTALVVLAGLSLLIVHVHREVRKGQEVQQFCSEVARIEGRVLFDYMLSENGEEMVPRKHPVPRWVRRCLGEYVLLEPRQLILAKSTVSDEVLRKLCSNPVASNVNALDLSYTRLTDESLPSILALRKLDYLALDGTKITGHNIHILAELPLLANLTLENTSIGDANVDNLAQLLNCRCMLIVGTRLRSKRVKELRERLPYCKIIDKWE